MTAVTVASASIIPSLSIAAGNDETSFPKLAARFEAIYKRWQDKLERDRIERQEYDRRIFELTGLSRKNYPNFGEPGWKEHMAIINRVSDELQHLDPVNEDGQ